MSSKYVGCFHDDKMAHTCDCSVCVGGWDTVKRLPGHWLVIMDGQ